MTRPLVRAVFAVLVVATVAAFFATQQLKGDFPLVLRFATKPAHFSPNGDDYRDTTEVGFDLSEPASVTFLVVDAAGNEVRRIVGGRRLAGDSKHRFTWDGRDDGGNLVPDGTYRMRVVRRDESRVIDSVKEISVDRRPPRATLLSAQPSMIAAGVPGQTPSVRLRYRGPANRAPEFRVFRTGDGAPHVVRRFRGNRARAGVWDGQVIAGEGRTEPAPEGDYAFTVTVRDRAGNPAVAPAEIPRARSARSRTGVSVRGFTLRGPLSAVTAGAMAHLEVGPVDRSFEWVVSRLGDPKPVLRGARVGGRFRIHIPSKTRTGVYLVRVRAGRQRAVWPLAVAGLPPRRAAGRSRPLVVLPALTWQGLNRVDDDADGFADRLPFARAVRLERPFAGGGLPPRFDSEVSPLLRWLDRQRLAYDLTTDVALARREGPALGNAPGVAFAGSELWLPEQLLRRLRDYAADGGRVAAFGADSFRRSVELRGDTARNPSKPRRENAFGEQTELVRTSPAPLTVFEDGLGLFEGLSGFVGEFTVFEASRGLPSGARRITAAGRDPGQPAFLAIGLGGGIVLRAGTPQWARELEESALSLELPQVTKRIWRMLSAGGST
ncbi:MAG TPA: N,N-dimethylformamidase beta subunit family domain-containing protein [Thermoleophilaceae bacterium]|nr:N,N-dimethylformamidase beta subunit family domain-containing protein [Thermoleophilaceae bacterium]